MKIGVPKEIKNHEYRVAMTPAGVHAFVDHGHQVMVQVNAGVGSGIEDAAFIEAGAQMIPTPEEIYAAADMIVKVKEPLAVRVRSSAHGPDPLHLPAPGPGGGAHRSAHRERLRGHRL